MVTMVNLIAIAIFVILGLILLRMEHMGRKAKWVLLILVGLLIYISVASLFTTEGVDLGSPGGIAKAVYLYFGWMGRTLGNLWDVGKETVHMVGDAISFNISG